MFVIRTAMKCVRCCAANIVKTSIILVRYEASRLSSVDVVALRVVDHLSWHPSEYFPALFSPAPCLLYS